MNLLKEKNKHPLDSKVSEHPDYAENHIYLIEGEEHPKLGYKSVTQFISTFFEKFDADKTIEKYYDKWQKQKHPQYYNKTAEEIKQMWDEKRDTAAAEGTHMHLQFELFDNEMNVDDTIPEFEPFMNWRSAESITPFRTEMTVYHPEYKLVGNVDLLALDSHGNFIIVDYKRTEMPKDSTFGKKCKEPLKLPHTTATKHALQLNIYKKIFEDIYGYKIRGLYNLYIKDKEYKYVSQPFIENIADIMKLNNY